VGIHGNTTDQRLRALLEEMINDAALPIENYPQRLKAIATAIPHGVRIVPAPLDEPLDDFNCVMYALGIVGALQHPCGPLGRYYADTSFLRSLIDAGELRPDGQTPGALVTWSSEAALKHVGVLISADCAVSKWGRGHICEHGLFEVPASMGDRLAFYAFSMETADVIGHLARFHHWVQR